jgi:hypothetical protein
MTNSTENDRDTNWRLIRTPTGGPGSGRDRYAAAMYFFKNGDMDAETLEVYRICAKLDNEDPLEVMRHKGIGEDWIAVLSGRK